MRKEAAGVLVALGALTVLTGCQSKFTHDRFDMIQRGTDNREDVQRILGKPTWDLDEQWVYENEDRFRTAVIYFDAEGRVSGKEWMDANTGEWSGQNPNANEPPQGEVRERRKKTTRIDDD
jgi:outer membrane protein assembly factor BamE (lipoprotein component of BamABCDE complex)